MRRSAQDSPGLSRPVHVGQEVDAVADGHEYVVVPRHIVLEGRHACLAQDAALTERIMSKYQAYISGQDGHFIRAVQLEYPNDISAAAAAQQLLEGDHGVELWQLNHKIAQFDRRPDATR